MCGPRRLLFFQCGPETPRGWTPLQLECCIRGSKHQNKKCYEEMPILWYKGLLPSLPTGRLNYYEMGENHLPDFNNCRESTEDSTGSCRGKCLSHLNCMLSSKLALSSVIPLANEKKKY